MQLADVFKENLVFLEFTATNKDEAIGKLVDSMDKSGSVEEPLALKNAIFEREKLGTTGIGDGIAIPHARCSAVKELTVGFFRSGEGIDFNAIDGKAVHLIFLLLAPVASGGPYLKLLAKISSLLRNDDFRIALMEAATPASVIKIIMENE